jgi:hypothetical protein
MANTEGLSGVMLQAGLGAVVNGKTLKAALYLATASVGPTTAAYTATGEVTGSGYTGGGVSVTNGNSAGLTGAVAYWTPSASISFTAVTLATAFDTVMIYSTSDTNRNISTIDIGSNTITAGTLTLTMPTNDASTGLIRIS